MTPLQESLGKLSLQEIDIIKQLRADDKKQWFMYGKSLEIALSISDSKARPVLASGQANILTFMGAIDLYIEKKEISNALIKLVTMKKSKYREALIEHNIWTEEIYLNIYNSYTSQKKLDYVEGN